MTADTLLGSRGVLTRPTATKAGTAVGQIIDELITIIALGDSHPIVRPNR